MSVSQSLISGFNAVAQIDSGKLTLGDREPCRAVIPDGVNTQTETGGGRHRSTHFCTVACLRQDLGESPKAGEIASLEYSGTTYKLAVSEDDQGEIGGAIVNFTLAG